MALARFIVRHAGYTLLRNDVKRFPMGPGECRWCGQERRVTYDYRAPGQLDYRLNRPTHRFCGLECFKVFWY